MWTSTQYSGLRAIYLRAALLLGATVALALAGGFAAAPADAGGSASGVGQPHRPA